LRFLPKAALQFSIHAFAEHHEAIVIRCLHNPFKRGSGTHESIRNGLQLLIVLNLNSSKTIDMKQVKNFCQFIFFGTRFPSFTFLVLMMVSFSSCFQQYYKTNTASKIDSLQIQTFQTENKVLIVHAPDEVFMLKNANIMDGALHGERETLNPKYEKYLNPDAGGSNRYPKKERAIALSEVHLYTNDSISRSGELNLSISQIYRVDEYSRDKAATHGSTALSIVGIVAPVVGIIVIGAAASSEMEHSFTLDLH
jgi:hypothetical protein